MSSTNNLRNGYDAFISHNQEDKAWARELAGFIANTHLAAVRFARGWTSNTSIPERLRARRS